MPILTSPYIVIRFSNKDECSKYQRLCISRGRPAIIQDDEHILHVWILPKDLDRAVFGSDI